VIDDWYVAITSALLTGDYRHGRLAPPPLDRLGADTMLAVAPVPGKVLEEWRHAALGAWMAWPHADGAVHAVEMTAAQLRAILAARDTP